MPERLQWTFAALFLLCGVPLLFVDSGGPDPSTERVLAGMAALFLGAFGLCLAWGAWDAGAINLQHFRYSRTAQPFRFAAVLVLILAAGVGTLATAVRFLLFK